ncbi:MAG TPA: ImmA/IrrE family metallo-endopeptidase [Candidatus Saccharimonadales bacterium]|nr:ImmA/IrrE family metallo-endopeptidase [Candidatus Saccharimonadales bacterium]
MSYARGFKSYANKIALEVRDELNLSALQPLNPEELAYSLGIPIWTLSDFAEGAPEVRYLLETETEVFSAVTVFAGSTRTIVHNDGHALVRQRSNIAHELAHALLLHPPTAALDDRGCRHWDEDVEDEASWLAGTLLVTEDAALAVARGQISKREARETLGVSDAMLRYRINMTGAHLRVQREAKYREQLK